MQIVIEIPKEEYEAICKTDNPFLDKIYDRVKDGLILPECHGRLIDVDNAITVVDEMVKKQGVDIRNTTFFRDIRLYLLNLANKDAVVPSYQDASLGTYYVWVDTGNKGYVKLLIQATSEKKARKIAENFVLTHKNEYGNLYVIRSSGLAMNVVTEASTEADNERDTSKASE